MKQSIGFISSLNHRDQKGGAALRHRVFEKIYSHLGYDMEIKYQNEIQTFWRAPGLVESLGHSRRVRSLFKTAKVSFSQGKSFYHLDSLRHCHWKIDPPGRKFLNSHNLEFESYFERKKGFWVDRFLRYETRKMREMEHVFVCSEREKEILIDIEKSMLETTTVVPNLVESKDYISKDEKNIILFTGTLDYFPNIKAMEYLISPLFTKVMSPYLNKYEFIIAGRNCPITFKNAISETPWRLKENVSDYEMKELLASTYVNLVPLLHGSGTRLKVIEGLLSGNIILSTQLGAEGVESGNIVYADLHSFSKEFTEILQSHRKLDSDEFLKDKIKLDIDNFIEKNNSKLKDVFQGQG